VVFVLKSLLKKAIFALIILNILSFCIPGNTYSMAIDANPLRTQINFDHLTTSNGLSHSTVNSIIQDQYGFMWFGTGDGVDKYDGYSFTHYSSNILNDNSLSNVYINVLYEDSDGYIWIGTNNGLNCYDRKADKFTRFYNIKNDISSLSDNNIFAIHEDSKKNLWIGTNNGLNKYDKKNKRFKQYFQKDDNKNFVKNNCISSVWVDTKDNLWIGTDHGIAYLETSKNKFTRYCSKNHKFSYDNLADDEVNYLFMDKSQNVCIGTQAGLSLLNTKTKKFRSFQHNATNPFSITNDNIVSIIEDNIGKLWIGTEEGGVNILDTKTWKFSNYKHDAFDSDSISSNSIYSIFQDKYGVVWIGTYRAGLNKVKEIQILHYKSNPINQNSLSDNTVHTVYEDKGGLLWIGTESGGLNVFDRKKNTFHYYMHNSSDKNSLCSNAVWSVREDYKGDLWVGTYDGLNRLRKADKNSKTNKFSSFKPLEGLFITSLLEDCNKNLWIATSNDGIFKYDSKLNTFKQYKHNANDKTSIGNDEIWCLYEDNMHNIWIGFEDSGVDILNVNTCKFEHKFDNSNNKKRYIPNLTISIFQDSLNNYWFGTWGNGLFKYNQAKDTFENFSEQYTLLNDVIYGILEDSNHNLWLSTNNGIAKFNQAIGEIDIYDETFGVQNKEFNIGAYCKTKNQEFVFGGINGFNILNPETFKTKSNKPKIVLTNFKILDESVKFDDDVSSITSIPLNYKDDTITFEFASLDYTNASSSNKYKYRLKGFKNEWLATHRNSITYTNLESGNYTFEVRPSDDNGEISTSQLSIKLTISPPPWKSWWAYSLYLLTIFLLIIISIRFYLKRQTRLFENKLHAFADSLTETLNLKEVYKKFFDNFKLIYAYDSGFIVKIVKIGSQQNLSLEYLVVNKQTGISTEKYIDIFYAPINTSMQTCKPILMNDTTRNNAYSKLSKLKNIRSFICIPIIYCGNITGVAVFHSKAPYAFKHNLGFAIAFTSNASISMENARLFNELNISADDVRNLLDNTGQGFLSFNKDLIIHNEYSLECFKIFGCDIKNKYLTELFCADDEQREFFKRTIDEIFSDNISHSKQEIYLTLLPEECITNGKTIQIKYKLIKSSGTKYNTIMMVLTDISERRNLESEMKAEQDTLKMVVKVITHFNDFVEILKEYHTFCDSKLFSIFESDNPLAKMLTEVYLEIHTFKGNFAQLDMLRTSEKLHDFENLLSNISKNINYYTADTLSAILRSYSINLFVDDDLEVLKKILGESTITSNNVINIDVEKLIELEHGIAQLQPNDKSNKLIEEIKLYRCKSMKEILYGYIEYTLKLSEKLEKMINLPKIEGDDIMIEPEKYFSFTRSLVHVFRNAVDHGIEFEDERIVAGKNPFGSILCKVEKHNNTMVISIADDGRGISIDNLRNKSRLNHLLSEEEILKMSDTDILDIIFTPEFSTKNVITEISGRGIGLSAVREEVLKLGGNLKIETKLGEGTTFKFILPL
jgi:ligand-binding sensor domain-containing protein/signal transduction histidine kinase